MTDNDDTSPALIAARFLRSAREAAGLSQSELASRSGVSQRTISHIETGTASNPRVDTFGALAEVVGVDSQDLITAYTGGGTDRHTERVDTVTLSSGTVANVVAALSRLAALARSGRTDIPDDIGSAVEAIAAPAEELTLAYIIAVVESTISAPAGSMPAHLEAFVRLQLPPTPTSKTSDHRYLLWLLGDLTDAELTKTERTQFFVRWNSNAQ